MPKAKKTKTKVGIKKANKTTAVKEKKPTGKPPKSIRMLTSLATFKGSFQMGQVYNVPADVPVETARSWVAGNSAEKVT